MPNDAAPWSQLAVRHGESTWNAAKLIQGHNDEPELTDRGQIQAHEVGEALRGLEIDLIYSSDLRRASETARIIRQYVDNPELRLSELLRERSYGVLEGQPSSHLTEDVFGVRNEYVVDVDARPEGGESLRDLEDRARVFLAGLDKDATHRILVVTHGGTIRALRAVAQGTSLENSPWERVGNCSQWVLRERDERHQ